MAIAGLCVWRRSLCREPRGTVWLAGTTEIPYRMYEYNTGSTPVPPDLSPKASHKVA
jgi:hypothetical protein